jgi:hypothetical protein
LETFFASQVDQDLKSEKLCRTFRARGRKYLI